MEVLKKLDFLGDISNISGRGVDPPPTKIGIEEGGQSLGYMSPKKEIFFIDALLKHYMTYYV